MKTIFLLITLLVLEVCKDPKSKNELRVFSPEECEIIEVKDSTITTDNKIIGFQFICEGNSNNKTFNLFEDNPWLNVDFPRLAKVNPYIHFNQYYETSIKQGFISFDLEKSTYQDVKSKFHVTANEQIGDCVLTYASTQCRYKTYLPYFVIINYILLINGSQDTLAFKNSKVVHVEDQLKIFRSNGEIAYELNAKDYACTGALLDSTFRFLFLRTSRLNSEENVTGFEIRDIQQDSLINKFEMDASLSAIEPQLFGKYCAFSIFKHMTNNEEEEWSPYQIIVFDISKGKLVKRSYDKNYKFRFEEISNDNLIYIYGDDEGTPVEYDTFKIIDMKPISSSRVNLQYY